MNNINNEETADTQRLIEQLRAENELKTKWLSLIAHDFRGLFSNISMLLSALESESISQEIFLSLLPELKETANKNSKTLESTFQWVKSQTDGFNPIIEDIGVFELYLEIKQEFEPKIAFKNISLSYIGEEDFRLRSDRILLTFILKQTIENAIKYSFEGGEVKMIVNKESDVSTIMIEDCGMGMNKDVQNNLGTLNCSPYTGSINEKGAGLGLVVVRDFVEMLNAKMTVSSTMNEGTTVSFKFSEEK